MELKPEDVSGLKVAQLKKALEARGLSTSGKKAALVTIAIHCNASVVHSAANVRLCHCPSRVAACRCNCMQSRL